tara:strand:- start:50351 stop:50533 length:183 start_codon:yes stop_codon:yes gene_type:complete
MGVPTNFYVFNKMLNIIAEIYSKIQNLHGFFEESYFGECNLKNVLVEILVNPIFRKIKTN